LFHSLIKGSIILAMLFSVALIAAFIYAYEEISLDADKLINYKPEISSVVYDRNGEKLAYVFKKQHRLYARYDEMPGFLVEALVAMEDTRFFEHNGVNPDAILRAIIKDIQAGAFVEGGSTLTQQLIKNKILTNEKKLARKIKEAILALKIEDELSKEDIIERYLNEISYGNNYFGIKTAANGYFHKELHELTHKEMAILVGLPNAPSYYNPLRHYKRALNRANNVLYRMKSIGWITQSDYLKAVKEAPKVYKTSLTQNIAPEIVDEVLRRFKPIDRSDVFLTKAFYHTSTGLSPPKPTFQIDFEIILIERRESIMCS
jgi:penicillin-binding protein 1A